MMLLAMAIGVGAVVMLTALGEGARRYVVNQFSTLGSHLLIVLPGRSETSGGAPPLLGETPRDLTLDDALALQRGYGVVRIAPLVIGAAPVAWRERERESLIIGTTADFQTVRQLDLGQGKFLTAGDPRQGNAECVIGQTLESELFGRRSALGQWLRIGEYRFRVIGVLADTGQAMGMEMGEIVIIPVASAQTLFNTESLFRVMVQTRDRDAILQARESVRDIIRARHEGEDDVTIITQDAILATFDRIFTALTFGVGGIAAISLGVAGILIMNVMLVAVSQRRAEIGLLKALGASQRRIQTLFLTEAGLLSLVGGLLGLTIGLGGNWLLGRVFPNFPLATPYWASIGALTVALGAGLSFGLLPARRAARLDPVDALMRR